MGLNKKMTHNIKQKKTLSASTEYVLMVLVVQTERFKTKTKSTLWWPKKRYK